jgi:hypothetical protein
MFSSSNRIPSLEDRPLMADMIDLFWWVPAFAGVVVLVGRLF